MYSVQKCVYTIYVNIHTLQVRMSTSVVIHYIGWGCRSPNPQEIHCFKWEFGFRFVQFFQECNPGIKRELCVPENHDHNIHFDQNVTYLCLLVMCIVSRCRLQDLTYCVVMAEEITSHRSDIDKNCDPGTKSEGEEDSQSKGKATLGRTPNHLSLSTTSTLSAGSTGSQARLIQSSHQPENYQPTTVKDLGKPTCMQCYLSGKYMPK
jgi:hypothetical protein